MDGPIVVVAADGGRRYPTVKIGLILLLIAVSGLLALSLSCGHTQRVKGVSKIEAEVKLSLADLSRGTSQGASPYRFYATLGDHRYRLVPTGQINVGPNEYAIEGIVPQFDPKLAQESAGDSVPLEVLTEATKIFDQVCQVNPEFAKVATKSGFATTLWWAFNEEGRQQQKVLVILSITPAKP